MPPTSPADAHGAGVVRVGELLAWEQPRVELVGERVGLERAIRWPLPTDLLDPAPYLRGDELVLTSGLSMREGAQQRRFVAAVCAAGAAAIGYALGVVSDTVPAALVRAANARGLAVLSVPAHVPFVEITQRIAVEQNRSEAEARERVRVGSLIELVRRGQARSQILHEELDGIGERFCVAVTTGSFPVLPAPVVRGTSGPYEIAILPADAFDPSELDAGAPCGWSGPATLERAGTAIREAFAASAVALRRGRTAGPRDLVTWDGLIRRLTPEQTAPFAEHVIGPLRAYDARHRTHLLASAEALCGSDGAVVAAAAELFVHENTLRKRAARIEELTGLNPLRGPDRAAFAVALLADADGASVRADRVPFRE